MQGDDRLVELIEWHFAALVSGNNMPHMSGDPRARLHPGQRRRLNDASRAALAALRQHRPDVAAVLDGDGGWQPIETVTDRHAHWVWHPAHGQGCAFRAATDEWCWMNGRPIGSPPTHWRALPPPPEPAP